MKILCRHCHSSSSTFKNKRCRTCRKRLSFASKCYGAMAYVADVATRGPLIQCHNPACGQPYPLRYPACPNCRAQLTGTAGMEMIVAPVRKRLPSTNLGAKVPDKRVGQELYLVFSLISLAIALWLVKDIDTITWLKHAGISLVLVAMVGMVIRFSIPRHVLVILVRHTTWVVKLALVSNYVVVMILVSAFIEDWWSKAVALATVVAVTWGGAWIICYVFYPTSLRMGEIFLNAPITPFDPTRRQGREGWYDSR